MQISTAVIIVNWNSWKELERCLDALKRQSVPFRRILVIDNNSTQPMTDSLCRLHATGEFEFHRLSCNVGFARANNMGIELVKDCDWIALVNPDAFLHQEWHEQMQKQIIKYPATASFSSALLMESDHACWDGLGDIYQISGRVRRNAHGRRVTNFEQLTSEPIFSSCAAAAIYRRDALLEVGGFDDDYFCYVEDVDLGFRLRLRGYESLLAPQAIAYHVGSVSTGGQHSDFAVYHGHRNLVWTFFKDMPSVLFWLLSPLHILMNLAAVVWFTLNGQGRVIIHAKWDAIKGLPSILRKRKIIQSARRCSTLEIWRMLDKGLLKR